MIRSCLALTVVVTACAGPADHAPDADARHKLDAEHAPTLDVASFEPPFEELALSRAFIASHHITRISKQVVVAGGGPTIAARTREVAEYDANGRPVHVADADADLVTRSTYVHADPGDVQVAPPEGTKDFTIVVDAHGRVSKTYGRIALTSEIETPAYDDAGHVVHMTRTIRDLPSPRVDGTASATSHTEEELRTYDPSGRLIARTLGALGEADLERLALVYDADGRLTEMRGRKPGAPDDRYAFSYDGRGQLAAMTFSDNGKDVYRRAYTYDADGFLTRSDLTSFVPAMGSESFAYVYELAGGHTWSAPPSPSDAAGLGAPRVYRDVAGCRIEQLAIVANGDVLGKCTGSFSPKLVRWDPATLNATVVRDGVLAFARDGRRVVRSAEHDHVMVADGSAAPRVAGSINLADYSRAQLVTNGRWLALGGMTMADDGPDYGQVELMDLNAGTHRTWQATDFVGALAFSPDGRVLAIGGATVSLWTVAIPTHVLSTVVSAANSTGFLGFVDDHTLVTATATGGLQIWQLGATPTARSLVPGGANADGVTAADVVGDTLVTGHVSGMIREWSIATGRETAHAHPRPSPVVTVAISSDGASAVTGDGDGVVLRWSLTAP